MEQNLSKEIVVLYWNIIASLLLVSSVQQHESAMKVKVTQLCLTLCDPMDWSQPGSSVHGIFQDGILEWVAIPFSRGSSQPRDWTQVSHIADGFFTIWAARKTQKTSGVGCYALLQGIFPTQGLNPGFLHCGQILYCLSHQESPHVCIYSFSLEPPTPTPDPPLLGHPRSLSWAPGAVRQFPPAIQLTHARVYIPVLPSQFILTSPAPPVSPSPFSTSEPVPDLQICSSPFF